MKNSIPSLLFLASLSAMNSSCADDMSAQEISFQTRCEFMETLLPYSDFNYVPEKGQQSFKNIPPESSCYIPVESFLAEGLLSVPSEGYFTNYLPFQRAEVAKMVTKVLKFDDASCSVYPFSDMETHWANDYAIRLAKAGLLCNLDKDKPGKNFGECFIPENFDPIGKAEEEWTNGIFQNLENSVVPEGLCENN